MQRVESSHSRKKLKDGAPCKVNGGAGASSYPSRRQAQCKPRA